ncbi:hypothetical protein J132_07635 [Termitomyces sp. J132]|nr:hypothetical protein J132_07635 [Termitomyces sp. J132]
METSHKTNGGVRGMFMKKMYEAVVVLSMTYATDVWCITDVEVGEKMAKGSRKFMEKLQRVQRIAALQMLGVLRTTPTDMLEAHMGLLPIGTRIKKICVTAVAIIALMPDTHPLYKQARRAAAFVKRHRALLHYIMKALGQHPCNLETIAIVRHPLDWQCLVKVRKGEQGRCQDIFRWVGA